MSPFDRGNSGSELDHPLPAIARKHALWASPAMQRVQKIVDQSANSDLPVLITGEIGAGKDMLAREIHRRSSRASKPLLKVHCAGLAPDFFDSRAFRRERESPIDSLSAERGAPSSLEGGTLFLDDIAELSHALQDSLLQLLREDEARSEPDRRVDFRLIAVTHHDLTQAVASGSFSEDLYYRINLLHVHVPALRAHPEDIPALLEYFLELHAERGGWPATIPPPVLARFRAYHWPGNVRELENAVRRLVTLRDSDYVLGELEAQLIALAPVPSGVTSSESSRPPSGVHALEPAHTIDLKDIGRKAAERAEREAILDMLGRTFGNKKEAAQRLGISYKALLYKVRDFGIARPRGEHSSDVPARLETESDR